MKKKALSIVIIGTMLVLSVVGCGDTAQTEATAEVTTQETTEAAVEIPVEAASETTSEDVQEAPSEDDGYAISKDNIKVGQYKGISADGYDSDSNESDSDNLEAIKNGLFDTVISNSELGTYPEEDFNRYVEYSNQYYSDYAEYLKVDLNTFITENLGLESEEKYNEYILDEARKNLLREYVITAISEEEGITISDAEIDEEINNYIEQGSFATEEDVLDYISREEIALNLKYYKILDIIYDNAVNLPSNSTNN